MTDAEVRQRRNTIVQGQKTSIKQLTEKLKAGSAENNQSQIDDPDRPASEPLCCSDECQRNYTALIKNRVDNLNESTLFILNEGVAPFAKLKGAARALG